MQSRESHPMLNPRSMSSGYGLRIKQSLIAACLGVAALRGNTPMESLYDHRQAASLKPYACTIRAETSGPVSLFPVPQDNAVGTNDLNNAITVFTFYKDRMLPKTYFKNAFQQVGGGGQFLPVLSKDSIGFGQTRRFVIYNFITKKFETNSIVTSFEKTIKQVGIADAQQKHFIFEIEAENPDSEDYEDVSYSLLLMDLSGEKPRLIKKIVENEGMVWSMFNNQLFLSDFKNQELKVFTANLEPSHHPVMDVLKKNKDKVRFFSVIPHPSLPFAVLSGGNKGAQYVCWNQTFRDEQPRNIFGILHTLSYVFSPDGRWVVCQKTEPEPKYSFIMPVSEKYPNYLGSPILLEEATFDRDHFAWTTNPVNLIGSATGKLYCYDLTKEGHPECGDKPSYWDYVVDKDLEKLRKEKKQGLGMKP